MPWTRCGPRWRKKRVPGLEAFNLPRFMGFKREDGTFSGDGEL
jgi:hypothetical protein